jgi:hypothetical protein
MIQLDIDRILGPVSARGKVERRIAYALIKGLGIAGFDLLGVYDGDEYVKTSSVRAAMELIFNLDESFIYFRKPGNGMSRHYVFLVLGNGDGTEVITDYSYTDTDPDGFDAFMKAFDSDQYLHDTEEGNDGGMTMVQNLQKAARDRETVTIGGGDFGPAELMDAANVIGAAKMLRRALSRLTAAVNVAEQIEGIEPDLFGESHEAARSALYLTQWMHE